MSARNDSLGGGNRCADFSQRNVGISVRVRGRPTDARCFAAHDSNLEAVVLLHCSFVVCPLSVETL